MGNNSRFINHSCDPNCELQLWLVKGRMHIGIVSLRDIEPDEPLSYDYQFDTNESNVFKCYCGTAKCRGTMAPRRKYSPSDVKTLPFAQRSKLLLEAKNKLLKSEEQQTLEEMQLFNCTGKFVFTNSRESRHLNDYGCTGKNLPGEKTLEVRAGPSKNLDAIRDHNLFLPRNSRYDDRKLSDFSLPLQVSDVTCSVCLGLEQSF
jgi:hypothetical protein